MHVDPNSTKTKISTEQDIDRTLLRMSYEIVEKHQGAENLVLVGIRRRGEFLARRLVTRISEIENRPIPLGLLDITFYRDDIREKANLQPELNGTDIPFDVTGKRIILVDDVLYTGRTVRAALDELTDLGRPASIELCVLVDRGWRELPVMANYIGRSMTTFANQQIDVKVQELDGENAVYLIERKP